MHLDLVIVNVLFQYAGDVLNKASSSDTFDGSFICCKELLVEIVPEDGFIEDGAETVGKGVGQLFMNKEDYSAIGNIAGLAWPCSLDPLTTSSQEQPLSCTAASNAKWKG